MQKIERESVKENCKGKKGKTERKIRKMNGKRKSRKSREKKRVKKGKFHSLRIQRTKSAIITFNKIP